MRRITMLTLATLLLLGAGTTSASATPQDSQPIAPDAIYADGTLFGTIFLNPLPFNDNPQSFDKPFLVPGQQPVAEAAPGAGYNGGRWLPVPVTWNTTPHTLISDGAVQAAAGAGDISLGTAQHEATFLCPLIRGPKAADARDASASPR